MCNLSQGIREDAREEIISETVFRMDSQGYTKAQIAGVFALDEKQVEEILKNTKVQQA